MLANTDYYENNNLIIKVPYVSELSFQLQFIKAKLSKKELENFNEYSIKRYDVKYPNPYNITPGKTAHKHREINKFTFPVVNLK